MGVGFEAWISLAKEARCCWRGEDARERRAIVRRLATKRAVAMR